MHCGKGRANNKGGWSIWSIKLNAGGETEVDEVHNSEFLILVYLASLCVLWGTVAMDLFLTSSSMDIKNAVILNETIMSSSTFDH